MTPHEITKLASAGNLSSGIKLGAFGGTLTRQGLTETAGMATQQALVAGGIAAGAAAGGYGISKLVGHMGKVRNYKKMLGASPDLQDMDQQQVRQAYNTVHHMSPHVAGDPLSAGSMVRNVLHTKGEMGETFVSPDILKNLADVQFRLKKQPSGIGQAMIQGATSVPTQVPLHMREREWSSQEGIRSGFQDQRDARQRRYDKGQKAQDRGFRRRESDKGHSRAVQLEKMRRRSGMDAAQEKSRSQEVVERLKDSLRRGGGTLGQLGIMSREERIKARAQATGRAQGALGASFSP